MAVKPADDDEVFGFDHINLATLAPVTRCTTLVPMPSVLPIFNMPMPSLRSSRMRSSTKGSTGRRPSFVPFALARASPALTRSVGHSRQKSLNRL
jgi:hypothetical protein